MSRVRRIVVSVLALPVLVLLAGCQARQTVDHYLSFDAIVTDLYDKHVLYNLARRDNGGTMVQINYTGFSANIVDSLGTSGKVEFFTNPETTTGSGPTVSLNAFQQSFTPTVNSSVTSGLNINSAPADNQDAIRAMYDEQVRQPEQDRVFRRTTSRMIAMRSYCWIRTAQGDLYYVPFEKHAEFSAFVHRVCFYKPAPPVPPAVATQPAAPASVPSSWK